MQSPSCPHCGSFVFLESQSCPTCAGPVGFDHRSLLFVPAPEEGTHTGGARWVRCSNWSWRCNWVLHDDEEAAQCFSCRLTRRRPEASDTLALERLAEVGVDKRRLLVQLLSLGLPVTPYHERDGGLAFDLISSFSGEKVTIGHADGVITIDLAESLDSHRESLRVSLGEPYRTMLGHFRHEVGHYYQQQLATSEPWLGEARELFGDERASYSEALERHYASGAPDDWSTRFISEYATMHPWEDFAETFAHYLHITGTLFTAANAGVVMRSEGPAAPVQRDIVPLPDYSGEPMGRMLEDWHWLSLMFNRVNRSMGQRDLYPFALLAPVQAKLEFMHRLITSSATAPPPNA